jgi:LmbE family N-acetylglucosaminyl deacetylase
MLRRNFCISLMAGSAIGRLARAQQQPAATATTRIVLEGSMPGQPHNGKVLLAVQAHSDDIPLFASGTVAKLIEEGYTGYLIRATNDDMGDAVGLGTPGTIGEHVLGNERDNAEVARVLGCKGHFDLNYNNHRMGDVSLNEVIGRLIFLIRLLKVDTVVGWDPWGHDEENPDHYTIAKALEAASWMAGRAHDFPEQFAAGLKSKTVQDKYYFARRPEITRVVDISKQIKQSVISNCA